MKLRGRLILATALTAALLAACGEKAPETPASETPTAEGAAPTTERTPHVINTAEPVDGDATLTTPPTVMAGAQFEADWTGPANAADYIDIVPRGYSDTTGEISYVYIRDAALVGNLNAPVTPGEYDVRYLAELTSGRVVKTVVPLTVTPVTVTFDAPPATATGGEPLSLKWVGPNYKGDYIDIVPRGFRETSGEISYTYTEEGNPTVVRVPGAPGEYDIRYVMEGRPQRTVMATAPLTVTASPAALVAPLTAAKGAAVTVTWTGPNRKGDYVDLVPKGFTNTSGELSYFYTDSGHSGSLKAPAAAGDYTIRYVLEAPGGRQILATAPLKVQ